MCVSGGVMYAFGNNSCSQLGIRDSSMLKSTVPRQVKFARGKQITAIAAGDEHSACLDSNGNIYTWGNGAYGQLMNAIFEDEPHPTAIYNPSEITFSRVRIHSVRGCCCSIHARLMDGASFFRLHVGTCTLWR